jgi:hypothetical protein
MFKFFEEKLKHRKDFAEVDAEWWEANEIKFTIHH